MQLDYYYANCDHQLLLIVTFQTFITLFLGVFPILTNDSAKIVSSYQTAIPHSTKGLYDTLKHKMPYQFKPCLIFCVISVRN